MMPKYFVLSFVLVAGCRLGTPAFHCTSDSACQLSAGSGARCIDGGCAEPTSLQVCVSGLAFDHSAGARAGQCVAAANGGDMALHTADLGPRPDLAPPLTGADLGPATNDLAPPVVADLGQAPACVPGTSCTPPSPAGLPAVGACAGKLSCTPTLSCNAAYNASAQTMPAPNGSWDWNCDGTIEVATARPANLTLGNAPADGDVFCRGFNATGDKAGCCLGGTTSGTGACTGEHWFANIDPNEAASCGETITHISCYWGVFGNNAGCHLSAGTTVVQACF